MTQSVRTRILRALGAAHPEPLDNLRASDFDLPDFDALVAVLEELRADGLIDYRHANFTGYDRVREVWLTGYGHRTISQ